MKKLISVVIVIIMLCPVLVGCGNSENKKLVDTNKLTLYVDENSINMINDILKVYRDKYPDVEIELVNMSGIDKDEYELKMRTEMLAGKGPDVIINPDNVYNLYKTMQAGVFCDLDELIKQDKEFQLSDYNEKVMDAGVFNGKRYLLPLSYGVPHLLTTQSILDETGIDINKSNNYIELSREINKYLSKGNIKSHIFSDERETLNFFRCYGDVLVDYDKATVNFDSNELKEALSMYKNFSQLEIGDKPFPEVAYGYSHQGYENLINKAKVFEIYNISFSTLFYNASMLKAAGEKPIIIPIRSYDGKIRSRTHYGAGIRANSKNKKNAFNFIKIMLSANFQQSGAIDIPVRKDSFDMFLNSIESQAAKIAGGVAYSELPEEYLYNYKKVLNEIESSRFLDDYSYSYILRYLRPFFNDEKSYEECLKAVKSAFEIYVSE